MDLQLDVFSAQVPSDLHADDPVLAADFLVSEIMTARLLRDPDNEEAALGFDPLEREAVAAVRCLGVGGVGEEFFAKAAAALGGKQKPPLLKGTMNRWVCRLHLDEWGIWVGLTFARGVPPSCLQSC